MTSLWRYSYVAVMVAVVMLPWYVVRWQVAGIPTTLLEVAIGLVVVVWCVEAVWQRQLWLSMGHFWQKYRFGIVWMALFGVSTGIAVAAAPQLRDALGIAKAYVVEPLVLLPIIVTVINADRRRWKGVFGALLVAGTQVMIVSFSQAIVGWPDLAPAELQQGRISSFFNTANAVGLFLAPLIIMVACLLLGRMSRGWQRVMLSVWLLLGLVAIYLSKSDGAVVALLTSLLLAVAWWLCQRHIGWSRLAKYWRHGVVLILAGYVVACLGYVWWFNKPPQVANPYTRPGFSTLTIRQCTWEGTKRLLQAHPLVGSGLAGFSSAYVEHATCDAEPLVYPHMLVLNFWVQLGALGALSTIGLLAWWLWQVRRLLAVERVRWMGIGISLAVAYWLVHGLVDVPYFKNDLAVEWWVLLGLTLAAGEVWPKSSER